MDKLSGTVVLTFGSDYGFLPGAKTVETVITSATLKVDGKTPPVDKRSGRPALSLTAAQMAAIASAPVNGIKSGRVIIPARPTRGRPTKSVVSGAAYLATLRAETANQATRKTKTAKTAAAVTNDPATSAQG